MSGRTFDMAELRVGLGALFFAPKRRFMIVAAWGGFWFEVEVLEGGQVCVQDGCSRIDCLRE